MSQTLCPTCNSPVTLNSTICYQCKTPLNLVPSYPAQPGIVLQDGYVLPPPPAPPSATSGVWQDGSQLLMSKDAQLPNRCVKCNVATERKMKRNVSWHHPAIYLLIVAGVLIYVIVAMVLRKSATIYIGVCDDHYSRYRRNLAITGILFVLCVLAFVFAVVMNDTTSVLLAILFLFGGIVFGVVGTKLVLPAKIDNQFIWLKGVNREYLNSLPHRL